MTLECADGGGSATTDEFADAITEKKGLAVRARLRT